MGVSWNNESVYELVPVACWIELTPDVVRLLAPEPVPSIRPALEPRRLDAQRLQRRAEDGEVLPGVDLHLEPDGDHRGDFRFHPVAQGYIVGRELAPGRSQYRVQPRADGAECRPMSGRGRCPPSTARRVSGRVCAGPFLPGGAVPRTDSARGRYRSALAPVALGLGGKRHVLAGFLGYALGQRVAQGRSASELQQEPQPLRPRHWRQGSDLR